MVNWQQFDDISTGSVGRKHWRASDDIFAVWLYDCFCRRRGLWENKQKYISAAADICNLKPGSFRMKLSNIACLEQQIYGRISSPFTPLAGKSRQNAAVFKTLFEKKNDLRDRALAICNDAPGSLFLQKNILKPLFAD